MTTLDDFAARTAPAWLKDEAVPAGWDGTPEEWTGALNKARRFWEIKSGFEFVEAVRLRGYTPAELATGRMGRNREVSAVSGHVRDTLPPSTISQALRDRAQAALSEVHASRAEVDPITLTNVEAIARGTFASRNPESHIAAVKAAVAHTRADVARVRAERSNRPVLDVPVSFRALGRSFAAGLTSTSPDVVEELSGWKSKMEAQARAITGKPDPREAGTWRGHWPPFRVLARPARPSVPVGAD